VSGACPGTALSEELVASDEEPLTVVSLITARGGRALCKADPPAPTGIDNIGGAMSDPTTHVDRPPLYEVFDDAGKAWLDQVVQAFNEGGYQQAVNALLADEAAAPGAVDD